MTRFGSYRDTFPNARLDRKPNGVLDVALHTDGGFDVFTPRGCDKILREGRKVLTNILDVEVPMITALNGPVLLHIRSAGLRPVGNQASKPVRLQLRQPGRNDRALHRGGRARPLRALCLRLRPAFQASFREHQPKLLAIWGRNDPFVLPPGAWSSAQPTSPVDAPGYDVIRSFSALWRGGSRFAAHVTGNAIR